MGKPSSDPADSKATADSVSLHTNPGPSDTLAPYHDEDAPELNVDALDDLPPVYSDALAAGSSQGPAGSAVGLLDARPAQPGPPLSAYKSFSKDQNTGAEYYVDRGLEQPKELERHIKYLATIPPRASVKIRGTHTETTRKSDGKTEKNTVTDFDVSVEMTPYLYSNAQYRKSWAHLRTVDNSEKARRGTVLRHRAPGSLQSIEVGGDPKPTLEEWCHRFAASHAGLKCFALRREVTGFDFLYVKEQLHGLVRGTNYRGHLQVELVSRDAVVEVYNDAATNRWRLTGWIYMLCVFTLMFVFTWPYLLLRTKRWEVAVAEWPYSRMGGRDGGDGGAREYVSISEEQWYNMWGRAIVKAVLEKRQTVLDQNDLRRVHEPQPDFESGNEAVDGAVGFVRAGLSAMNEVNRQFGWGADC